MDAPSPGHGASSPRRSRRPRPTPIVVHWVVMASPSLLLALFRLIFDIFGCSADGGLGTSVLLVLGLAAPLLPLLLPLAFAWSLIIDRSREPGVVIGLLLTLLATGLGLWLLRRGSRDAALHLYVAFGVCMNCFASLPVLFGFGWNWAI